MSAITRRLDGLEQDRAGPSQIHVIPYPVGTDPAIVRREREEQLGHAIPERDLVIFIKRYSSPLGSP